MNEGPNVWSIFDTAVGAFGGSVLTLLAVAAASIIREWRRRISFHASQWQLSFDNGLGSRGQTLLSSTPTEDTKAARYTFMAQFFSDKSEPVGLHRFAIEFTKGRRPFTKTLVRDDRLLYGAGEVVARQRLFEKLTELTLQPKSYTSEMVRGSTERFENVLQADRVWLVAETPERRKKRWLITQTITATKPSGTNAHAS